MRRRICTLATAAGFVLSTAIFAVSGSAAAFGSPPGLSARFGDLVQHSAVVCGYWGCVRGGRAWGYRARHWGYADRPACPLGYYFACRRGPLGYGACACWPYRWH
jgi:hypothetical protein